MDHLPVNWFDFAVLIVIFLGMSKGRKNGMSVELLGMFQWLAIIFAGAFLYRPLGDTLCKASPMNRALAYIGMYITIAIVIKIIFSGIKKAIGPKLLGTNLFGKAEYYLGMIGGAVRFACVLVAALALLNAPYYSPQELARSKAAQLDLYGSDFFPGLGATQQQVFKESLLGSTFKHSADFMLIASTRAEHRQLEKRKVDLL